MQTTTARQKFSSFKQQTGRYSNKTLINDTSKKFSVLLIVIKERLVYYSPGGLFAERSIVVIIHVFFGRLNGTMIETSRLKQK